MSAAPVRARSHNVAAVLKPLGLTDEIVRRTIEIYESLEVGNHKIDRKKRIVCYCILQAYTACGRPDVNIIEIGSRLGLSSIDTKNAIANHPAYKPGYAPRTPSISITDVLKNIMTVKFDIDEETVDEAAEEFTQFINTHNDMLTKQPLTVVAGYLMYWMMHNGYSISDTEYAAQFSLHIGTIRTMFNSIKEAAAR